MDPILVSDSQWLVFIGFILFVACIVGLMIAISKHDDN
jgi:hypothetical protein